MATVKSLLSPVKKGEIDDDSLSRLNERMLVSHIFFLTSERAIFVYSNEFSWSDFVDYH